ncbi:F0F1 ATP synthase subunit delta [Staphylococcus sp. 11261D007BR]
MANVAQRYARALFDVAQQHEVLDEVYSDFIEINTAVQDKINYLKQIDYEPKVSISDRKKLIDHVFKGINPFLFNTLKIVAGHRNFRLIDDIFTAFKGFYNESRGLAEAHIETAQPLTDNELIQIKQALINRIGLNDLIVESEVNDSLIGGVRVKIGTKVYDGSVQNDLEQLVKKFNRAN